MSVWPYATTRDIVPTVPVTRSAVNQKSVWLLFMSRMSDVFMPKTETIKERGKKNMIVTRVKMRIALELPSSVTLMFCRSVLAAFSRSLRNWENRFSTYSSRPSKVQRQIDIDHQN